MTQQTDTPNPARLAALDGALIVFDLDGTLVDTAPDLVAALNKTLAPLGRPPFTVAAMRGFVGKGARHLITRAGAASGQAFDEPMLATLTDAFIDHYRAAIAVDSRPFPGCIAALDALANAGAVLAVCTNKRTELSLALLDALGMTARFAAIVGADAAPARKPDPSHFLTAVERSGGPLHRSVMVGDSSADIASAGGAGRPCVLALFGYLDQPAEALGASAAFNDYGVLPGVCAALLARGFAAR